MQDGDRAEVTLGRVFLPEALHVAHLMAAHGYFFPIDDHSLAVKNDNTFYRFQTPYFWPSNCWEPENTDYGSLPYDSICGP